MSRTTCSAIALVLLLLPAGVLAQHAPLTPPRPATPPRGLPVHLRPSPRVVTSAAVPFQIVNQWNGTPQNVVVDPPDPHGAAGPKGILEINNLRIAYRQKDGGTFWATNRLYGFFPLQSQAILVDPRVMYDAAAGRFYALCVAANYGGDNADLTGELYLAVSRSSHPLTSTAADWYFFVLDVTETKDGVRFGPDYPCIGFDAQAVYITTDMFRMPFDGGQYPLDVRIMAFDKSQLLEGTALPHVVRTAAADDAHTLQPVSPLEGSGPAARAYFVEVPYWGPDPAVRLWSLDDPLGAAVLRDTLLETSVFGGWTPAAPQCDVPYGLNTLPRRAQGNVFLASGEIWFCYTGASGARSSAYYDVVAPHGFPDGVASVVESGLVTADPESWAFQPAIGGNLAGEVCMVFTQSGTARCPGVFVTARSASDGAFGTPQLLKQSPVYHTPNRPWALWGDYGVVSVDPVDQTFWTSHEFADGSTSTTPANLYWQTVWGNVVLPRGGVGWPGWGRLASGSLTPIDRVRASADGAGGIVLGWIDTRDGNPRAFATRLLTDGSLSTGWKADGTKVLGDEPVSAASPLAVAPDGAGGGYFAVVAGGELRVQHLTAAGAVAPGFPETGIALDSRASNERLIALGGDAVVLWLSGTIRAQRVGPSGELRWGAGATIGTGGGFTDLVDDGSGGTYVGFVFQGVRLQHLAADGVSQWAAAVNLGPGTRPLLASDPGNGLFVVYQKTDADGDPDLYALHVDANGAVTAGWPAAGLALAAAPGAQSDPQMTVDAGAALVSWADGRRQDEGDFGDVYLQRLEPDGHPAPGWPPDGVVVCAQAGVQQAPRVIGDGAGGALMAWQDGRSQPTCTGSCDDDLYALRLDATGVPLPGTPSGGVRVAGGPGAQQFPVLIPSDAGHALVAWEDGRTYPDGIPFGVTSVYVQRLPLGIATAAPPAVSQGTLALEIPWPNPARGRITFRFQVPERLAEHPWRLAVLDVAGREVASFGAERAGGGPHRLVWDPATVRGTPRRSGVYFVRLRVGGEQQARTLVVL